MKAFAGAQGEAGVYSAAGISPPDPQGTLPPPAAPTQFSHRINPDGTLTLRWKARQPRGVVGVQYGVSRRLAGESTFTLVDIVGSEKQWTDETLPAGIAGVAYLVQPQRGGRGGVTGPAGNMHVVRFGVPGARGAALQMAAEEVTGQKSRGQRRNQQVTKSRRGFPRLSSLRDFVTPDFVTPDFVTPDFVTS